MVRRQRPRRGHGVNIMHDLHFLELTALAELMPRRRVID
jgi:hypothetical protein